MLLDECPVSLKNEWPEAAPDQLLALLAEIVAVGLVDEGERSVGQETADQFGLILDDIAVLRLALADVLLACGKLLVL